MHAEAFCDGGGHKHIPNSSVCAAILILDDGTRIEKALLLAPSTNNQAEYEAVLLAIANAIQNEVTNLTIYTDSRVIVNQIRGIYETKNEGLRPLLDEVLEKRIWFETFEIYWIPREKNRDADRLCRKARKNPSPRPHPLRP